MQTLVNIEGYDVDASTVMGQGMTQKILLRKEGGPALGRSKSRGSRQSGRAGHEREASVSEIQAGAMSRFISHKSSFSKGDSECKGCTCPDMTPGETDRPTDSVALSPAPPSERVLAGRTEPQQHASRERGCQRGRREHHRRAEEPARRRL